MKKFFVEKENFSGEFVNIVGDEFFHFSKVLRGKVGEKIICLCGDENQYFCEVVKIEKDFAVARVNKIELCTANPKIEIAVFQGLPKGEKLELIIQKISELGASEIVPFESDFTIAKGNPIKMERLEKIAREACKQCGRSKMLKISPTIKLCNIEKEITGFDLVLFLYENAKANETISALTEKIKKAKKVAIIIGAEGGFSESENEFLSKLNIEKILLGKRILRTETATIALVGFVSLLTEN